MRLLSTTILVLCIYACVAQPKPIKFGVVLPDDLRMEYYERDSSANAVILSDKGRFNGTTFEFTRHVRIKILKPAGTSWGNFVVNTPTKGFINGYTFNLQNGMVVSTKLDNKSIYEEEIIEGFDVYKIFFPDVKVGSVIDLEYTHEGLPFEWRFQERIPVIYSELEVDRTQVFYYKKVFYGFEKIREIGEDHWAAEHVPPLREEPFMTQYSNLLTRFQFDIESIKFHGSRFAFYKELGTWEKVSKFLMEQEYFGGIIDGQILVNEKAREIEQSNLPLREKVAMAINFIKENIKWNNNYGLMASRTFREDFKDNHSGNSGTINLLLIALLKKAGVTTYPVVLSTRDHGLMNPVLASLNKLNYVVGQVRVGNEMFFVDATTPHAVPDLLPEHCLNTIGWAILLNGAGELVDLNPGKGEVVRQFVQIKSNEANELIAEITNTYEQYAYLSWIRKYEKAGSEAAYQSDFQNRYKSNSISSYKLQNIDREKLKASESIQVDLSSSEYLEDIGGELLLNPFILNDIVNPFKAETRQFPIDFIVPKSRSIIVSVNLPSGFEVKSLPQSSRVDYPGNKARFVFLCNTANNIVNLRCDFAINTTLYTEEEYEVVRSFFSEVIKKMGESIQIVKKT